MMDSSQETINDLRSGRSKFVMKLLDAVARLRLAVCYQYDNLKEGEIRLLRILPSSGNDTLRCRMLQGPIDKLPEFNTLSYTWVESPGDETQQVVLTEKIFLNRRPYPIAPNLLSALRYYRQNYAEPLWVDFLCINQVNLAERGKQVSYMRQIYQSASLVLVWLGDEANNSGLAMDFLQRVSEERDTAASVAYVVGSMIRGDHLEQWKALDHFWKRRYWRRTWIMQEQAFSKQIDMACGQRRLEWEVLYRFVDAVQCGINSGEMDDGRSMIKRREFSLCVRVLRHLLTLRRLREQTAQGRPLGLLDALHSTHRAMASDARDKIYGILAFVKDASILVPGPDYTCPVQTVFIYLVLTCIHHYKKLDILAQANPPHKLAELPSWAPDWSATERTSLLNRHYSYFRAAGHTAAAVQVALRDKVLVCEGIFVDTLDGLGHSMSDTSGNAQGCHAHNATSIYSNDEATFSAIWRSLIGDAAYPDPKFSKASPRVMGRVFAQKCKISEKVLLVKDRPQRESEEEIHPANNTFILWYQKNRRLRIAGRSIRKWAIAHFEPDQDDDTDKMQKYAFEQWMMKWMYRRKLITTETGYIGLAPVFSSRGDKVCVLFGCSTPVILRPLPDGYYQFVGECYVHGLMHGEAIAMLNKKSLFKQEFALR
jgi:Heterokaryon incompatibility protein (HET)